MFVSDEAMKNNHKKNGLIKPLIIVLLAILIATPIVFAAKVNIDASANVVVTSGDTKSSDEDYTFVLIDEEDIPLAAAPKSVSSNVTAAVVGLILASITLGYFYWYMMVRRNIAELAVALSPSEKDEIYRNVRITHPRRLLDAEREAEAYVANKYFDSLM